MVSHPGFIPISPPGSTSTLIRVKWLDLEISALISHLYITVQWNSCFGYPSLLGSTGSFILLEQRRLRVLFKFPQPSAWTHNLLTINLNHWATLKMKERKIYWDNRDFQTLKSIDEVMCNKAESHRKNGLLKKNVDAANTYFPHCLRTCLCNVLWVQRPCRRCQWSMSGGTRVQWEYCPLIQP